jgi:hypothetical protein
MSFENVTTALQVAATTGNRSTLSCETRGWSLSGLQVSAMALPCGESGYAHQVDEGERGAQCAYHGGCLASSGVILSLDTFAEAFPF